MKVLFLSVTAGQGHHSAANALIDYLRVKNVQCNMLDTFEYINPLISESIARGYLISTKVTPTVYGRLYRLAEKKEKANRKFSITKLVNSILSKKLIAYIDNYEPDVIVCTHIFSAQIITQLKRKKLKAKTIGIITDFTIHPFWEDTDLDYYITANELLNRQVEKKGIALEKIRPLGIPINAKFSKRIEKSIARHLLDIDEKMTIFVMSGSMGYGNVIKVIKNLDALNIDFQIISVCGNNRALRRKINKLKTKKTIYNYGFTDKVDIIMDASDCIVTKPGGLTVSESLAKAIPMILVNPIPGQEDRNMEFLLNNGLAIKASATFPIDEAVFQLITNKDRYQALIKMMEGIGRATSSQEVGDFIIDIARKEVEGK